MMGNIHKHAQLVPEAGIDGVVIEPQSFSLDERMMELEANLIRWALHVTGGNKSRAAALLQIKRSTLGDRINRCGIGSGADSMVAV